MHHHTSAVPQLSHAKKTFSKSNPPSEDGEWSFPARVAFRLGCVFLLLISIPFPFEYDAAPDVLPSLWHRVVPGLASHVSHFSQGQVLATVELYAYFQLLTYVLIAAVVTLIWSAADRKRREYTKLHEWVRLYIRIYLAAMIFAYGSSKLFPEQFRTPSLARLLQPFGDYDRRGLMWNFMGVSRAYVLFVGGVEALAGVLLFIPRLRTLGALLCGAALTNVFALDMSYDISDARIYCFILLLMCGFLLVPDLKRLAKLFVLNRKVDPEPSRPMFRRRWLNLALLGIQLVYGGYIVGYNLAGDRRDSRVRDEALLNNRLRGIWYVDEFQDNHQMHPPLTTDPLRWQRVVIDSPPSITTESGVINLFTTQSMTGSLSSLTMDLDLPHHLLLVKKADDSSWTGRFNVSQPIAETLILDGQLDHRQIHAKLRLTHPQFKLTSSGFRWIPEFPRDPWNP